MKTVLNLVLLLAMVVAMPLPLLAVSYVESQNMEFGLNRAAPEAMQKYKLGTLVSRDKMWDMKAKWKFSDQGGAISTINLHTPYSNSPKLPNNAIVVGCYIDVLTAPAGTGGGTIAFATGQGAGDLLGATVKGSYTGIVACTPTGTAATSIKLTADRTPTIAIASAAFTAGEINVHILYLLSD